MTVGTQTTDRPGKLGTHELVLLHGQPGSPADWLQVAGRLPAQLHAVAADRPGYGASQLAAGGFTANAHAVLDDLDSRGIQRAVLVGHSYGGGVALSAASLAPHRVEAVVLLASVGPGCLNGWDKLLAAPGAGPLCALVAWQLTPWIARARLNWTARRRGRPPGLGEQVNWQIWAQAGREHGLWRTFLTEQRALLRELAELEQAIPAVQPPVLLLADPRDTLVPVDTARRLVQALPDARLQLVEGGGHHLPRRVPEVVADAIVAFVAAVEDIGRQLLTPLAVPLLVEPLNRAFGLSVPDIDFNSPEVQAAEIPSSNGICTADGLLVPTRFASGFMLPTEESPLGGPASFGHPGRGGSLGFADPGSGIAFGYVVSHIRQDMNDTRAATLVNAVRACCT